MTIGEVAEAAGVNRQTLRYYERRGIVEPLGRSRGGYRLYPPETARVVRFIKKAQELGFTLEEIEVLLSLRENEDRTCGEVRDLATEKLSDIDQKIARLQSMRDELGKLVRACTRSRRNAPSCAVLDALEPAESEVPR